MRTGTLAIKKKFPSKPHHKKFAAVEEEEIQNDYFYDGSDADSDGEVEMYRKFDRAERGTMKHSRNRRKHQSHHDNVEDFEASNSGIKFSHCVLLLFVTFIAYLAIWPESNAFDINYKDPQMGAKLINRIGHGKDYMMQKFGEGRNYFLLLLFTSGFYFSPLENSEKVSSK